MPFYIISVAIQLALIIHIIKTGRSTTWIWVVAILPLVGSLAYIVMEVLPDLSSSKAGRKAQRNIGNMINPEKDLNEAARDYSITDTVDNSINLAEQCLNKQRYSEARTLFEKCLTGIHAEDPAIMYGLARAEFGLENYSLVKSLLDDLKTKNPDYKNPDAHLLYARSLEEMDQVDEALHEYDALEQYYPGPEAACRYALLLKRLGKNEKARDLFDNILHRASYSGKHYNEIHKEWIRIAKKEFA